MTKIIILVLILFLGNYKNINSQWRVIDTGVVDTLIIDMSFPDSLNGWAITPNKIIHSSDGGEHWELQDHPVDSLAFWKILFVNDNIGYIIGYGGLILATKDGGNLWVQQDSRVKDIFLLRDLSFVNENTGWIAGLIDNEYRGGVILKTTNGGITWEKQIERKDGIGYYAINFLDINNGWALSSYGWSNSDYAYMNRTFDGGLIWDTIGTIHEFVYNMTMSSADTIWTGGFGFSRSFDGGKNWDYNSLVENFPGDTTIWFPIIFVNMLKLNNKNGYAVISRLRTGNQYIPLLYSTQNGGLNWDFVDVPGNFTPTVISVMNNYFFIGGFDGLIITNKLPTKVENFSSAYNFELCQNYPNPFNPITTISYQIAKSGFVSVKVYDVLGKEVSTLVNEIKNPGEYSVNFNANNLPSGIYFYLLTMGNAVDTKKMILLK